MIKVLFAFLVLLLWPASQASAQPKIKVENDKENVVASRLEGTWKVEKALAERLTGKAAPIATGISFSSDPAVAAGIPEKYAKFFIEKKMQIYMAGTMQFEKEASIEGNVADAATKLPFVLTTLRGNPHILFWLEKDGEEFGDSESFNVMLAVAKDKKNDLLFIGGDFNNQPFSAFGRKKLDEDE